MKSSKGFSLLETMVVIGLLAILTAIAVPNIISQRNTANLRDAVSMIRGDFKMAQSRAIRENAFVPVIITANGYRIFIDNGTGVGGVAGNWVLDGTERLLCDRNWPNGITMTHTFANFAGDITRLTRFNGSGYNTNNGRITLSNPNGKSATVDMDNRFGRVTVTSTY